MGDSAAVTVTVEDVLGEFGFRLRWSARKGWADGMDVVAKIDEAEPYLAGFVKWDGCAELDQGCPHWCGAHGFGKHIDLLAYIWRRAHELMGRKPDGYDVRATTTLVAPSR